MNDDSRYERQRRLAEVGDVGQTRIERARTRIASEGDGVLVELGYLERAGVGAVTLEPGATAAPFAHEGWFRFSGPRSVGAGAWRAHRTLRRILGMERA